MSKKISFGTVKWFGGKNAKTGKENDFGFIVDFSGKEIFIHKEETVSEIKENDIVIYKFSESNGKLKAINAEIAEKANIKASELIKSILDNFSDVISDSQHHDKNLLSKITSIAISKLLELQTIERLKLISEENSKFIQILKNSSINQISEKINILFGESNPLSLVNWENLPTQYLYQKEAEVLTYLETLSGEEALRKCQDLLKTLPIEIIIYLTIRNPTNAEADLINRKESIKSYFNKLFSSESTGFANPLKVALDRDLKPIGGYKKSPLLSEIVYPILFKKYLYEKDLDKLLRLYNEAQNLKQHLETFTLFNIFSLYLAGNSTTTIYDVFVQRLWEALTSDTLRINESKDSIASLFPSCSIMAPLSCEAIYWNKNNSYLCRGRECARPAVLPKETINYTKFSIYDWFKHYGIDYENESKPSKQDFPIKIGAYFNRLREIYPHLHCRSCKRLMTPNMSYSKTTYEDYENGALTTKENAAAYRLTVFHCNSTGCSESGIDYYINHCLGFGCYGIIDSRDLKSKCSKGRYICLNCTSCCENHSTVSPVGICPNCGENLRLYETKEENYLGRKMRRVSCPSGCGFEIPPNNLTQKFYLPHISVSTAETP